MEKALQLSKPPGTFVSALVKHIFWHPDLHVKFDDDTAFFDDRGFTQQAIEKKNTFLLIFQ